MDWVVSLQGLLPKLLVAMRSMRRNHVVFRWRACAHSQYPIIPAAADLEGPVRSQKFVREAGR
jgi:hypothetical protein